MAVPGSFKKNPDDTKLRFVVAFFFMVIVLLIVLAQIFYAESKGNVSSIHFPNPLTNSTSKSISEKNFWKCQV